MHDWQLLWAKRSRACDDPALHPLLCHLLDVAAVARAMWETTLSPRIRAHLAAALALSQDAAGRWVALLAGLHDLGKASPAFQFRDAAARQRLLAAGFPAPPPRSRAPHGSVTACTLPGILVSEFGLPRVLATRLGTVVGGHHGVFPRSGDLDCLSPRAVGTGRWDRVRQDLVCLLAATLDVSTAEIPQAIDTATAMVLAGLVSVADWIGSADEYFPWAVSDPDRAPAIDPAGYAAETAERARRALDRLHWAGWLPEPGPRRFADLFPEIRQPNRLQQAVTKLAGRLDPAQPGLVIIEAPMGEGKTEAALYLVDAWGGDERRGAYVALPTQATSDQMFGRVRRFLACRYPAGVVNLQLLHGHAALSAEFALLRQHADALLTPAEADRDGDQDEDEHVVAAEWFTYRKRGLLAPFGVGTIDQALLAALQTKHVFVRLFGLAGKAVIIDEVHAYDTYMTALLERLLEWLAALGSPVILLSATLPSTRRAALLAAYRRGLALPASAAPAMDVAYPRITWVTPAQAGAEHVPAGAGAGRLIHLDWLSGDIPDAGACFELGDRLKEALAGGGCAAVICNTVGRAQEVYRALRHCFPGTADDGAPELDLLHARFLFAERQRREQRALLRFGKPGGTVTTEDGERQVRRPHRAVLVATQLIEQSLDLDFDLMVSELAPADLVLQRAGRLHRHARGERPPGLSPARLWLLRPPEHDGVPTFDPGTAAVYDAHVLLRSWLAFKDRTVIRIPDDIEGLVEAVYDDRPCPAGVPAALRELWEETRQHHRATAEEETAEAAVRWIKRPGAGGFIWEMTANARAEDAPDFHHAHQALTRLAPPSVSVVCLFDVAGRPALDAAGEEVIDLSEPPSLELTRRLLARSVTIYDRRVVQRLLETHPPASWRHSALLRHQRLILLDPAGRAAVGQYVLRLDPELGLIVE